MQRSRTSVSHFFLYPKCYINTPLFSPLPRPHCHHCTSYPYVGVSQRNCKLAQTSSRLDAQVSVYPPLPLMNVFDLVAQHTIWLDNSNCSSHRALIPTFVRPRDRWRFMRCGMWSTPFLRGISDALRLQVWGLWVGFLIMCAGTLLGEILTY